MSVIKNPSGTRGRLRRKIFLAFLGGAAVSVAVAILASSSPVLGLAAAVGVAMVGVLIQIMVWVEGGPGDGGLPPSSG